MLDQSFSLQNFRKIFEIENRKGNLKTYFLSNDYLKLTREVNRLKKHVRKCISNNFPVSEYANEAAQIEKNETLRDEILENELLAYATAANAKNFSLDLTKMFDEITEKDVYMIERRPECYFVTKQLQYNISRTFKVKSSNRFEIVKQVKSILKDNFPKYVVRTDIKSFYESVPQERLLKIIQNNNLLSPQSLNIVKGLLYNYNILTNQITLCKENRKGIPRGVGVSAYLSELYMRTIDEKIKDLPNLTFYARYVDDIIVIFSPPSSESVKDSYLQKVMSIIENEGLQISISLPDAYINRLTNLLKTRSVKIFEEIRKMIVEQTSPITEEASLFRISQVIDDDRYTNPQKFLLLELSVKRSLNRIENNKSYQCNFYDKADKRKINFLGYLFIVVNQKFHEILLSPKKIERYEMKIEATIDSFQDYRKVNYKEAKRILIQRLSYLTKNTKLDKPKKGYVGIYYSNSLLEVDSPSLRQLNEILKKALNNKLPDVADQKLKHRLLRFCFERGFKDRLFFDINNKKMPQIQSRVHAQKETNFEKIVAIWK